MNSTQQASGRPIGPIQYPAGALLRVSDICRNTKTGQPGLLPINRATWYKWVNAGLVPPGRKIGAKTTVWPLETVLSLDKAACASGVPETLTSIGDGSRAVLQTPNHRNTKPLATA